MKPVDAEAIKAELLAAMQVGHVGWENLISRVDRARMSEPGVEGEWSVKDIIAHISTYEDWMAQLLEAGGPNIPHIADTMTQDETNAWVFEHNHNLSVEDVLAQSQRSFDRLLRAVQAVPPDDLVSATKFEWSRGRPVHKLVPHESHEHYRHHAESIRAWLNAPVNNDN
jgi:hypothetical protein